MRWHDLRHFYASGCASEGIDIYDVSVWPGHVNVSITQSTCVHLFKRSHSDAMSKLDEAASMPAGTPLRRIGYRRAIAPEENQCTSGTASNTAASASACVLGVYPGCPACRSFWPVQSACMFPRMTCWIV